MRRVIGHLLDPLVDLADERLVVCSLLGMGILHGRSPPSVVERLFAEEAPLTNSPAYRHRQKRLGAREELPRRSVKPSVFRQASRRTTGAKRSGLGWPT